MSSPLAQAFYALFAGLTRSHGTYAVGDKLAPDAKGKLIGPRRTVHEPYTPELWDRHLAGTYAIGVVPIREDNTVRFGAIDIDDYSIDLKALNQKIQEYGLPLLLCRTKSGGAHLYMFTKVPVSALLARTKLMEWAAALGHAGVEVFPKQVQLAGPNDPVEDSTGNWINMPYAQEAKTLRYGFHPETDEAMSPEEFCQVAAVMSVPDAATLEAIDPPEIDELFSDGPPCLQKLAKIGFGDWQNNGMFNVGVYLKLKHGEGWGQIAGIMNEKLMDPPVSRKELSDTIRSVQRKTYSYMCKEEPICDHCDRKLCLTRTYGVGAVNTNDSELNFGEMIKLETDPPVWIWTINDARIELTAEQLKNQNEFSTAVMNKLNLWPHPMKPMLWRNMINEKMKSAQVVQVPEDATKKGQLLVQLERFCTSRVQAKERDELLLQRPFTDPKDNRTYFAAADFLQFLHRHKFSGITEKEVWKWLRDRDGKSHSFTLKGKKVAAWSIPAFTSQTQDHSVPRTQLEDPM